LPFKNLKYISLDVHLENRGNNSSTPKKTTLSTLAFVIKSFVSDGKGITIIVNTSFPGDFIESEFFEYLDFYNKPTIKKKEKNNLISLLNGDDITQQAHQEILRNVIIREAIEVENLILETTLDFDCMYLSVCQQTVLHLSFPQRETELLERQSFLVTGFYICYLVIFCVDRQD